MKEQLINLEYLKFFCRQHQLVVGGRAPSGKQFWVSPMGPHSQDLSYDEVQRALVATGSFELKEMLWNEDADNVSYFVTRQELESELKELIH